MSKRSWNITSQSVRWMQWGLFVQDGDLAKEWQWFSRNAWACQSESGIMATRYFGQYVTCEHGIKYLFPAVDEQVAFLFCITTHFVSNEEIQLAGVFLLNQLAGFCLINAVTLQMHIIGYFQTLLKNICCQKVRLRYDLSSNQTFFFYFRNYFVFQVNISQADMQAIGNTITMVTQDGTTITVPAHDAVISSAGTHSVAMVTAEGTEGQQVRYSCIHA